MSRQDTALLRFVPSLACVAFGARRSPSESTPTRRSPPLDKAQYFALVVPVLLFSMVAHEYAHGYAALKQGDPTAYQLGRLTWNPLKHIDPFMTVLLPILTIWQGGFIFGGAKPVPVVPRNYRNFKRGDIIVSLAGIATNLALALIFTILIPLIGLLGQAIPVLTLSLSILQVMMLLGVQVNLMLAFFNLLPPAWSLRYQQFGMYGIFLLLLLFMTNIGRPLFARWMWPATTLFALAEGAVGPFLLPATWMGG